MVEYVHAPALTGRVPVHSIKLMVEHVAVPDTQTDLDGHKEAQKSQNAFRFLVFPRASLAIPFARRWCLCFLLLYDVGIVSTPEKNDFHVDMTFTGRDSNYAWPVAIGVAIAGIIFIVLTMTTNVAAKLLPMSDEYLQIMVPVAPDGGEPLSLTMLTHDINEKTISVSGSVMNRSTQPMSNIIAVVELQDTTGRFPQTQEILVMPVDLPPQATGTFMAMATLQEKPGGYIVKFRFADGPFIPHKDERGPAITITPQPTGK